MKKLTLIALSLALTMTTTGVAQARKSAGPDLPYSCDTVRMFRSMIEGLTRAQENALAAQYNVTITPKMRRQVHACLRGA
jgi:hypothetical protein